jgi:hypothetical protein
VTTFRKNLIKIGARLVGDVRPLAEVATSKNLFPRDSLLVPLLRPGFPDRMMRHRERPEAERGGHVRQLHQH